MLATLKIIRIVLCRILEFALIIAVAVLTLDVLWGVITRHLLDGQAKWTEELARFLLIWVSMLGSAAAFGEKAHLGVDYFVGLMAPSARKIMEIFSYIAVLAFTVFVFIKGGHTLVTDNLEKIGPNGELIKAQLTPALQLKMGYVYAAVPIAGIFIIVFTLEQLLECILTKPEAEVEEPVQDKQEIQEEAN